MVPNCHGPCAVPSAHNINIRRVWIEVAVLWLSVSPLAAAVVVQIEPWHKPTDE